jgi:hypothetical protein
MNPRQSRIYQYLEALRGCIDRAEVSAFASNLRGLLKEDVPLGQVALDLGMPLENGVLYPWQGYMVGFVPKFSGDLVPHPQFYHSEPDPRKAAEDRVKVFSAFETSWLAVVKTWRVGYIWPGMLHPDMPFEVHPIPVDPKMPPCARALTLGEHAWELFDETTSEDRTWLECAQCGRKMLEEFRNDEHTGTRYLARKYYESEEDYQEDRNHE